MPQWQSLLPFWPANQFSFDRLCYNYFDYRSISFGGFEMNKFSQAISRVLAGGATSFARYLASMISVLVVAVCLTIQTAMNYNADERIFGNLILAFGAGIFWGIALAVLSSSFFRGKAVFIVANLLSLLASGGTFFHYLYQMNAALPEIVGVRIFASCVAALFIFLLVISRDADRSDYNQASFMVLKSPLVISWIFTLVLFLGAMFIAFSVQSLLYKEMSQNVYTYISIWSSFFALAFFLGYFPRFSKDAEDPRLETAQKASGLHRDPQRLCQFADYTADVGYCPVALGSNLGTVWQLAGFHADVGYIPDLRAVRRLYVDDGQPLRAGTGQILSPLFPVHGYCFPRL